MSTDNFKVESDQGGVNARCLRILIASANPERIMLVREALRTWPDEVVCRMATCREDAVAEFEGHDPDVLYWDAALGETPPVSVRAACTLLLDDRGCKRLVAEPLTSGLHRFRAGRANALIQSINREYELRRMVVKLRAVQGTESKSRTLLNRATDGIVVVDEAGKVPFANPAAARMLGIELDEILGEPFPHDLPSNAHPTALAIDAGCTSERTYLASAIRTIWDGQDATVLLLQESPALSEPPQALRPRSGDGFRALGRWAAGITHEVNNPLTFVLANLESLSESQHTVRRFYAKLRNQLGIEGQLSREEFEALSAELNVDETIDDATEMLTDCTKGMHRIHEVARSLETFSRAGEETPELTDVSRVIDDACAMVFNHIRYRARLVKRFEQVPQIAAHPGRLVQALVSLLINAAEAIEEGPHSKNKIVVSTTVRHDKVVIAVSDTGAGVDESALPYIFTRGYTTKGSDGGMGLGLALCRKIAEQHEGRVAYHPREGGGSVFEMILPVDTGLEARPDRGEARPVSEMPTVRRRLLVIDDDVMVLAALRRSLRRRFDVVTVLGGAEALTWLEEDDAFDGIVCDLMMPEVDGKAFFETVETEFPHLAERTVFMSGGAFTPRLRKFAASVVNPVLKKPVTRQLLQKTLSGLASGVADARD